MCGDSSVSGSCGKVFGAMSHEILLVQPTKRLEGRNYPDCESVNECMNECMEGVWKTHKEHRKRMNPNIPPSPMISVCCLILSTVWQISAALFGPFAPFLPFFLPKHFYDNSDRKCPLAVKVGSSP